MRWEDLKGIWIYVGISLLLSQVGFLVILFLVPMQVLFVRSGFKPLLLGTGFLAAGILVARCLFLLFDGRGLALGVEDLLTLGLPYILIAGFLVMNGWARARGLYRVLAGTLVSGLLTAAALALVAANAGLVEELRRQYDTLMSVVFENPTLAQAQGLRIDREELLKLLIEMLMATFMSSLFIFMALTWRIGRAGRWDREQEPWRLKRFTVPDNLIWAFIASWGIILIRALLLGPEGQSQGGDWLFYVIFNVAYVSLYVYALQGLGILIFLAEKYKLGMIFQIAIVAFAVLLLAVPLLAPVLLFGLAILGTLELWIKFRKFS